jgi:nitrogen fixation NifU-like protein
MVRAVAFQGVGVIATEFAKGKTKATWKGCLEVHDMVMTLAKSRRCGQLAVFAGVHKYPARVKCAILAWHAVMAALKATPSRSRQSRRRFNFS